MEYIIHIFSTQILLITWAAIIIASSRAESNASNSNDEEVNIKNIIALQQIV